jgi:hypothetical protein
VTDHVALDASKNIAMTADVAGVDAMKSILSTPPGAGYVVLGKARTPRGSASLATDSIGSQIHCT